MIYVRHILDGQTGVIVHRVGELVQVRWDDGRESAYHLSEIEPYTPPGKIE
jgi:hypothetical protein